MLVAIRIYSHIDTLSEPAQPAQAAYENLIGPVGRVQNVSCDEAVSKYTTASTGRHVWSYGVYSEELVAACSTARGGRAGRNRKNFEVPDAKHTT